MALPKDGRKLLWMSFLKFCSSWMDGSYPGFVVQVCVKRQRDVEQWRLNYLLTPEEANNTFLNFNKFAMRASYYCLVQCKQQTWPGKGL